MSGRPGGKKPLERLADFAQIPRLQKRTSMAFDLILKGGRIIDPSQKLDRVADIAFADGKVAKIDANLRPDRCTEVRDVSGHIVTPGLIDMHTHVYWGGNSLGIDAEEFCRTSGVTTAVDTGSAGPGNFAGFRKHVIEPSQVRILAYLHVSHAGTSGAVPLRIALEVADAVGMPLMAHIDHPPPSYEEVIDMLRPGDILTHAFR